MPRLSLRYRIPLEISLVVLVTALAITAIVLWKEYQSLRNDAHDTAQRLGDVLAYAVTPHMKFEEQWHAYQALKVVYEKNEKNWVLPEFILVLDRDRRVLVSSDPVRFPLARPPFDLGDDAELLQLDDDGAGAAPQDLIHGRVWDFQAESLVSGEGVLGTLVLAYPRNRFWRRFSASVLSWVLGTGLALLIFVPFGWWLGRRIALPILDLDNCVAKLGDESNPPRLCPAKEPYTEFATLRTRVEAVGEQLRTRRLLERRVIRSERQAALGRLAAGVAHEINNPLGGMMTAIAMQKRHGEDPEVTKQTLSLLERGLDQIRYIVSALLVEVKPEQRSLTPADVEDISRLLAPESAKCGQRVDIENRLAGRVSLPAGPVRQVLLNLTLNALQAAPEDGFINVLVEQTEGVLHIRVSNPGESLNNERLERLFEPFDSRGSDETSLGLWLTDQTVRELGGEIEVVSESGHTTFDLTIPIGGDE